VYNAGSPSKWCASHRGYFFYISYRIGAREPELKDIEKIIDRLEAVRLPNGDQYGQRERLRMRAVQFDDKWGHYTIFVDYLVPTEVGGKVKSQSLDAQTILDQLLDGHGLYSDSGSSWYPTNWDVLRVKSHMLSDRFDADASEFYLSHMGSFEIGASRDGSASASNYRFSSWNDDPLGTTITKYPRQAPPDTDGHINNEPSKGTP
jgi:hypothetical protein